MNRVTLVVGAETAAGRAVLDRLSADGHLIAAFVEEDFQVSELEGEFDSDLLIAATLDPTDPDSLTDALDLAADAFGPPTGAVVALSDAPFPPLLTGGLESLTAVVEQRILGTLAAAMLAAGRMEDGGAVVLVAPNPDADALGELVAGALRGFVRGAARELAPRRISVNLVSAGKAEFLAAFLLSDDGRAITAQCLDPPG